MTQPNRTYTIVSRVHIVKWVDDLQTSVPGWDLRVRWNATRAILPVFVPDDVYTAANVDNLIRSAGKTDEQIHTLGG